MKKRKFYEIDDINGINNEVDQEIQKSISKN